MSKDTLVITGANGFIGANLIVEARKNNWNIKGIVRREESAKYVKELGALPIVIKELDIDAYTKAFEDCTAVVHLIGVIDEKHTSFQKAHVESTRIVIESAETQGLKRLINISGLGVDQVGKVEWANNPYFKSKWNAENLLLHSSIPFVNFRPSYIFGPESYWFASLFRGIQKGKINIIGDGLVPMQPIYVKDVVNFFLAAAEGLGEENVTYDMVGPEITNMKDMVDRVIRFYIKLHKWKKPVEITHIPYSDAHELLNISKEKIAISQCNLLGDNSQLIKELGIKLTRLNSAIKYSIRNFSLL